MSVAALLLAGCDLVDQRTFNPQAGMRPTFTPPVATAAPAPEPGPKPLLVVRFPAAPQSVRTAIAGAVSAAVAAKRDVVFDVVEVSTATAAGAHAEDVGQMIVDRGVPAARVHLVARPVAAGSPEVRVYVR